MIYVRHGEGREGRSYAYHTDFDTVYTKCSIYTTCGDGGG